MASGDITITHEPHPLYLAAKACEAKQQRLCRVETLRGETVYPPTMGGVVECTPAGIVVTDPMQTTITSWHAIASVAWAAPGTDPTAGRVAGVYHLPPRGAGDREYWTIKGDPDLVGYYPATPLSVGALFDSAAQAAECFAVATSAALERRGR